MSVDAALKAALRGLGKRLRLPNGGANDRRIVWSLRGGRVVAEVRAEVLTRNFQETSACAATYAWCVAWWLGLDGCRVEVASSPGAPPAPDRDDSEWLHWNRSALLLSEYDRLLGDRFQLDLPRGPWSWPANPVLNAARGARSHKAGNDHAEHVIEVRLTANPAFAAAFDRTIEPIEPMQRQLPVGLFEGEVSEKTRHTPGGSSMVDLWTRSLDGKTLHLFELKAPGNQPLGIVPEALYYGRIFEEVVAGRIPLPRGLPPAEQVVIWLLAPGYHPLLGEPGKTPLEWLRHGLSGTRLDIRFAPPALTALV